MPAHKHQRIALAAMLAAFVLAPQALATVPGKNGLITFGAKTGSGVQLFTVSPNGHDLRQITNAPGEAFHPDWSPDGLKGAEMLIRRLRARIVCELSVCRRCRGSVLRGC